jgi:peptidoglycan-N-acetylglucosamine deacetylase
MQARDMINAMWVQAALGLAAAAGGMAWAVRSPRSSLLATSVYRGVEDRRSIALTFDDGPSESTPRILELLERHSATSTFFQCGVNARRLAGVAKEVVAAGHEVGNHTETHPLLSLKDAAFMDREIGMAQRSIEESAGVAPMLFRAPFGVRWFGLDGVQRRWGLQGVMWSVIGLDWKWPAARVERRLLAKTAPGGIVCLHDGRLTNKNPDISVTLEALQRVLPVWVDQGFKFETVSQILWKTN